jgi:DNA (cytosine-5)-methyltransferase 1
MMFQPQGEHGLGVASAHRIHQHEACPTNGFWRDADWVGCRDGKWRAVEPGLEPLVDGATARVGRLRAYGNAISAPVAEAFIRSYMVS